MKEFSIHPAAEAEVLAAIVHYETRRVGLGPEFRQEFESAIDRIRRMPKIFAPVDDQGTRKHRLQRFPYTVYYVDLDEAIWIVAVAHQSRRPGYWHGRNLQAGGDA